MTLESRRPSLARQVGSTSLAQVASVLLSLMTLAVLARMLGPDIFGTFAIAIAILALGTVLADAGFAAVLVQRPAIDSGAIGAATVLSLALGLLSVTAAILLSQPIEDVLQFPGLAPILIATSLSLPALALSAVGSALLQRRGEFGRLSVVTFLAQLANSIVSIAAAWRGEGVWSLVAGYWAAAIVSGLVGGLLILAERPKVTKESLSYALRSGHVFTLAKVIGWAASSADQVVLARLLGATDLGIYTRVLAQVSKVNLIFGAAAYRVFFSSFSRMQENLQRLASAFEDVLSGYLIVAGLLSAFTLVFAEEIVLLLLGPGWSAAIPVLQIAALGMIARSGHVVTEAVPAALGLYRINAARHALRLILTVLGAVVGCRWGVQGAVWGSVAAFWIFYASSLAAVVRLTRVNGFSVVGDHLRAIALAAPAAVSAGFVLWTFPRSPATSIGAVAAFTCIATSTLLLWPRRHLRASVVRLRSRAALQWPGWPKRGIDRV